MKKIDSGTWRQEMPGRNVPLASFGAQILLMGLAAFTPITLRAQNTWIGDQVITGDLDVGTSGTAADLRVTGTTILDGKVGVGTSSPAAQTHIVSGTSSSKGLIIQGAASQSANLQEWQDGSGAVFGSISSQGSFSLNANSDPTMKLFVKQTGAGSGTYFYAGRFETDPGSVAVARTYGVFASATGYNNTSDITTAVEGRGWAVGTSGTLPRLSGFSGYGYHFGTGMVVNHAYGFLGGVGFYNSAKTGVINNAYGLKVNVSPTIESGQAVTNAYGLHVDLGATTNGYGVFVNTFNSAPSGNSYGVYIDGGTKNYFSGNVGIGTNFPTYKLHVVGNLNFTGTLFQNGTPFTSGAGWTASGSNAIFGSGKVGVGTSAPAAKQEITSTTEQLRVGYNVSNYYSTTVGSSGTVTFDAVGSLARFEFFDFVNIQAGLYVGGPVSFSGGVVDANFAFASSYGFASGDYSTAISGGYTEGDFSVAAGQFSAAMAYGSFVVGRNNVFYGSENSSTWVDSDPLFVVGNGTGDSEDPPEVQNRDAFIVYKNGNIRMAKRQGDILMGDFGNPE